MLWYWLWVNFTASGRAFDLSHKTTYEERKEISKRIKEQMKEYIYIIGGGFLFLALVLLGGLLCCFIFGK